MSLSGYFLCLLIHFNLFLFCFISIIQFNRNNILFSFTFTIDINKLVYLYFAHLCIKYKKNYHNLSWMD